MSEQLDMSEQIKKECCANQRSECPISCVLELIGDKWTLLLIRDVLVGKHRYGDFEKSPEQIPTNILAERLKRLVREEIMEKVCYQERPKRYAYKLTNKGADLIGILHPLCSWGVKYNVGNFQPPETFWKLSAQEILANQEATISNLLINKGQPSDA